MNIQVWSAIAASCSALGSLASATAAWQVWRIQKRNFIDSVRPEIELKDWSIEKVGNEDIIRIRSIHNWGKGPALHLWVSLDTSDPEGRLKETDLRLGPNEQRQVDFEFRISWKKSQTIDPVTGKYVLGNYIHEDSHFSSHLLTINFSDSRFYMHCVHYHLMIYKDVVLLWPHSYMPLTSRVYLRTLELEVKSPEAENRSERWKRIKAKLKSYWGKAREFTLILKSGKGSTKPPTML